MRNGVTQVEADNQAFASTFLEPHLVRVPRVHRFFQEQGIGYLVMDYINGVVIDPLGEEQYSKVEEILSHLHSISAQTPGNLGGVGMIYGCPFPDEGIPSGSVEDLEKWFKSRLFPRQGHEVSFSRCKFVVCHRDLAPRNLLWKSDGSVYLLDW